MFFKLLQLKHAWQLIDSYKRDDKMRSENYKRVMKTDVNFDNLPPGETFLVCDYLDLNGPAIYIYKSKANVMELAVLDDDLQYSNDQFELIAKLEFEGIYSGTAIISSLWVAEDYSEIGIATKLVQRLIEWAKMRGMKEIRLTSAATTHRISQDALDNFYLKQGFKKENRQMIFEV